MQGWFNIHKLNVIHHINRSKDKDHMIISIDTEKNFDKIQNIFIIKALMKLGIEGMFVNIIETIYDMPVANIILKGEKLKPFPLVRNETRMSTVFIPIHHSLGIPIQSNKQQEEIKGIQIGKEEVKLYLFIDNIIIYLK
jgi:hypothetical protein